jgi:PRTRC genetic system protein E
MANELVVKLLDSIIDSLDIPESYYRRAADRRLNAVALFARFLHAEDAGHEIPPSHLFPPPQGRLMPYIFSSEELSRIVAATEKLPRTYSLHRAAYATLFGLIVSTGLRISEALNIRLSDVQADGVLLIRRGKDGKSRLITSSYGSGTTTPGTIRKAWRSDDVSLCTGMIRNSRSQRGEGHAPNDILKETYMFKELAPYLRQRAVLLTVTHIEEDQIRVNVIPQKLKDGENAALTTPLTVTGTAEELDRELPATLVGFISSHLELRNTLDRAKAEMDAAAKTAQTEARSKTKAPAKREPQKPEAGAVENPKPSQPVKTEPSKTASLFDSPAPAATLASDRDEEEEILAEASEAGEVGEDEEELYQVA